MLSPIAGLVLLDRKHKAPNQYVCLCSAAIGSGHLGGGRDLSRAA
jgi:hypothetical protein